MPIQRPKRLPTDFFDRLLSNQTDDQINDLLNSLVDEQISPTVEPAEDLMPLVREAPPAAPASKRGAHRDKFEDSIITRDEELDEIPLAPPQDAADDLIPKTPRMQSAAAEAKAKPPKPMAMPADELAALETIMEPAKPKIATPPPVPVPEDLPEIDLASLGVGPAAESPAAPEWPEMPLPPEPPLPPDVPPAPAGLEDYAPVFSPAPPEAAAPPAPAPVSAARPAVPAAPAPAPAAPARTPLPSHEELLRRRAAARWEHPKRKAKRPKLAIPVAPVVYPPLKQDAVDQYLGQKRREQASLRLSRVSRAGLFFLVPAFIAFSLFSWYPMFKGLALSFLDYHPTGVSTFIGFANYARAFQDAMFWRTLMHAGGFCLLALLLGFWLPILLAIFIDELRFGKRFLKFAFFLPFLMPTVPAAILWKWLLDQGYGLVNSIAALVGMSNPHIGWLNSPKLALLSIVMLYLWKNTGWALLIYSAGLANIDETFYEEAEIDGASIWQKITRITLPSLRGVIGVMLIITIINTLQLFTEVYIMTSGGPMGSTEMIATYIYKQAFFYMDIGYASALSMLLLLMLLGITTFRLRRLEPEGA